MKTRVILITISALTLLGPRTTQANTTLVNLPARTWFQAKSSQLYRLCPPYTGLGTGTCVCVVNSWSGGDYSPNTRELILWGGGHNDYYGNEVYTFNLDTLRWRMVTPHNVNSNPGSCVAVLPNGEPNSRHTYGGVAVITHADRFFGLGGSPSCLAGGCRVDVLFTLDIRARQWHNMQPSGTLPGTACEDKSVYDPLTKKVYYHTTAGGWFAYDYDSNSWTARSSNTACYSRSAALDPKRRLIVEVGGGTVTTFDLTTPGLTARTLTTTGGGTVVNPVNPGLAYDPVTDRIIAWSGGADVYSLDVETSAWERITPDAANTINPGAVTASGGVYGRFRYIPDDNVFILVNDATQLVSFYKLTPGTGVSAETGNGTPEGLRLKMTPNPFHGTSFIQFILMQPSAVALSIVAPDGRVVEQWKAGEFGRGTHLIPWRPGVKVPSGVYSIRVTAGGGTQVRQALLLR